MLAMAAGRTRPAAFFALRVEFRGRVRADLKERECSFTQLKRINMNIGLCADMRGRPSAFASIIDIGHALHPLALEENYRLGPI